MTAMALRVAKTAGIGIDESLAGEELRTITSQAAANREGKLQGVDHGTPDIILTLLDGLAAGGYAPDSLTDGIVADLVSLQRSDGSWRAAVGGGVSRAPIEADNDSTPT